MKSKREVPVVQTVQQRQIARDISRFFSGCRNAFAVQDLMINIAAGHLLGAELVDVSLLPHALLLHAVAPEPGVVDDAVRLTERILEEYDNPIHGPRFWHTDGHLVSGLVYGTCDPNIIAEDPYSCYIADVYKELTNGYVKAIFALPTAARKTKQA